MYRALLLVLIFAGSAIAYDTPTHRTISELAFAAATLGASTTSTAAFATLGLRPSDAFPDSDAQPKVAKRLLSDGAVDEDNYFPNAISPPVRSVNHFYDPVHNRALEPCPIPPCYPSPTWALEDTQTIAEQRFSFRSARLKLYHALMEETLTDRQQALGETFEDLGHVIHHIQDMAQPQHVRNDYHGPGAASFWEQYTEKGNSGGDPAGALPFECRIWAPEKNVGIGKRAARGGGGQGLIGRVT